MYQQDPGADVNIPNYMIWSILSTIVATLCCCPLGLLGIIGIVQSNKVNSALANGDLGAAQHASKQAKMWCWIATALAIIGMVALAMFFTVGGGGEAFMQGFNEGYERGLQMQGH